MGAQLIPTFENISYTNLKVVTWTNKNLPSDSGKKKKKVCLRKVCSPLKTKILVLNDAIYFIYSVEESLLTMNPFIVL